MSQAEVENAEPQAAGQLQLESNTYEIIRNRLTGHGKELRARLEKLNAARKEVFGSIDTVLLGTERITTDHNCQPRDMVAVGDKFIFGYNVHFGLKTETNLGDVFAIYQFKDRLFHSLPLDLIGDERFQRDLKEVYRYYKNAQFAKFHTIGPHLYMVFQVGKLVSDIKTFKWLKQGDSLQYIDNRSDHEVRFPPQHEFEWIRTHRDLHKTGAHPHISIEDRVFVETVGGDLTIKIENNTDSGEGIYAEDVDDPDQTLDDAEIYYAIVGNIILLKIKPYLEKSFRYIVYNEKIQQAKRVDAIANACVLLPDDHGLIFSNGYYLQSGEFKTFESGLSNMLFERRVTAPNGEDYLYVFYNRDSGVHVMLRYNLIEQRVDTPMVCNGFTLFEAGEMVCFKTHEEPQKHHAVQIWQTPYVGEHYVPPTDTDSLLYKIGNRDIVRGMAECHEVLGLIEKEDTYANLYLDLVKESGDIIDSYFWIDNPETFQLKEPLTAIKGAAEAAVEEFEKVVRVKQNTANESRRVSERTREIINSVHHKLFDNIDDFVKSLSDLRAVRGEIISLRDLRYVDTALVDSLEKEVSEQADRTAQRCVEFLLRDDALDPYKKRVEEQAGRIDGLTKAADAKALGEEISASAGELEMLIEVVSNLKIDDATHRTTIIDNISAIFSKVNAARAALKTKNKELLSVEGIAEFNSQMKLLNQGVVNYLDICDTPDKCEEFLTKVMIQIEELEGRFAEFDEFVVQLTEKREEIYNAFETRKLALVEARNKRASALMSAAERILKGIKSRVESLESINDIHAYFASDLMIEKVRDICKQLTELEDTVKVDDIQSRLKTIREDAVRQLKDRQDLFVEGENVIKLGDHLFSVNAQALDLTTVLRDGEMHYHLTGTNFFEPIEDEEFLATRDVWQQEVISENRSVYRGEYLAHLMLEEVANGAGSLESMRKLSDEELLASVQKFMGPRYNEAYSKGVHDHDASKMLRALLEMKATIGLLRYHTQARALAAVYWRHFGDRSLKKLRAAKLAGFGVITQAFPSAAMQAQYVAELREMLVEFLEDHPLFDASHLDEAAEYLFYELCAGGRFAVSRTAAELHDGFQTHLASSGFAESFNKSVAAVKSDAASCFVLLRDWAQAYIENHGDGEQLVYADEVAAVLAHNKMQAKDVIDGHVTAKLEGLVGAHAVIEKGAYRLNYNQFMHKLNEYEHNVVPRYRRYIDLKKDLVEAAREEMRLEEFRPRVLSSFVRNKLIDSVYLPLIGDNLAKQMGVVGEKKRTDLMGLLLLVSPPGYGKTTLMEYVANRLGIIFMKINGPAIGHQVTSLDPVEAPNAAAREELEKLNLSLEMGDNVMIYVDDIQHCNPEFLQKFISLCDAQRKIEGVYKGKTRTYDLRGRKVCVVMAGNPYTESGEKFQIPDMLSNRADVYNLGEIIGDASDAFEMSYLENSLTSNPVLNKLAARSQKDVYAVIRMAERGEQERVDLEGNYSLEELSEMVAVMKKLMRVRDVILTVNREYIRSAAQSDDYRTEPPFKLQGSYRNMNRIAEKVVPIMNDKELETLILSNYQNDAQTLTSDNEANMLKFKELIGIISKDEAQRWDDIKRTFKQNVKMRGVGADDKVGLVIAQMGSLSDGLDAIRKAVAASAEQLVARSGEDEKKAAQAAALIDQVGAVKQGLETISQALAGGLTRLSELADRPAPQPDALAGKPLEIASDAMVSLADELRALTTGAIPLDSNAPLQRVSVMHKVPRSILDVMQSQFELMQNWMAPILQVSQANSNEIQGLKQALDAALAQYSALLGELETARNRGSKSKSKSESAAK